jgi:hypothetical protein
LTPTAVAGRFRKLAATGLFVRPHKKAILRQPQIIKQLYRVERQCPVTTRTCG